MNRIPAYIPLIFLAWPNGDGTQAAQTASDPVDVSVKTVDHDVVRGDLIHLSTDDGVVIRTESGTERFMHAADIVRVTTPLRPAERHPGATRLTLIGEDVLYGRIAASQDDAVVIETTDFDNVTLPLEWIRTVDMPRARQSTYRETYAWFQRQDTATEDRVLLTNGDIVRGFITAIGPRGVTIDGALGETTLDERLIVSVRLADAPPPDDEKVRIALTVRDSGRLTGPHVDWSGSTVRMRLRDGQAIKTAAGSVVAAEVFGGRWEWLDGHRPISSEHTPMLAPAWEPRFCRNVLGGPIRVAGEVFDHGIGVHSRSVLTFDLRQRYREFVTWFGIDDASGPYADVTVQIRVDGKPRFEQTGVTRGTLHGPIRLNIEGANRIELIADFGENGDIQDRFNWVEPALVR